MRDRVIDKLGQGYCVSHGMCIVGDGRCPGNVKGLGGEVISGGEM